MAQVIEFLGGPCAGAYPIEGEPPALQALALSSSEGNPKPLDLAAYRLDQSSGTLQYHFIGIARAAKFHNGPLNGHQQIFVGALPLPFEAQAQGPTGKVVEVCRYELRSIDGDGAAIYELCNVANLRTDDDKALDAVYQFYANPDYSLFTAKPLESDVHAQITIQDGNRKASVDCDIVEIVRGVWSRGWETMGSCQARPEGWSHPGMAYIWFPLASQGQAFAELLENAGIEYTVKEKSWAQRLEMPKVRRRRN